MWDVVIHNLLILSKNARIGPHACGEDLDLSSTELTVFHTFMVCTDYYVSNQYPESIASLSNDRDDY